MSRWLIACGDYPQGTSGEKVIKDTNNIKDTVSKNVRQDGEVIQPPVGFGEDVEKETMSSNESDIQPTFTNQ